jgi:alpha-L-rhamnosidase
MLYFNLDPENNGKYAANLSRMIMDDSENGSGHLTTGFIGVAYAAPALSRNGYTDTAYTILEQEAYPSWLYPVTQGATTSWERWDSYTHTKGFDPSGMNSYNHYAFGSVGEWLMSGVLGIDRDEGSPANVGFKRFILNPQIGGSLTYAKGHYDSMSGRIESHWTRGENGEFSYSFTVPANTTATVYIPTKVLSDLGGDGRLVRGRATAEGVAFIRHDAAREKAIYQVASGSYVIKSVAQVSHAPGR